MILCHKFPWFPENTIGFPENTIVHEGNVLKNWGTLRE